MADHFLQFAEVLPHLTAEEVSWLKHQLEPICLFGEREYPADALPDEGNLDQADWIGCRAYRDMLDYDAAFGEEAGFEWELPTEPDSEWGRFLWVYSLEHAELDRLVHLVQKFLRKFRPGESWALSWASYCSKPRAGAFTGGAIFVTAGEVRWWSCDEFLQECRRNFFP